MYSVQGVVIVDSVAHHEPICVHMLFLHLHELDLRKQSKYDKHARINLPFSGRYCDERTTKTTHFTDYAIQRCQSSYGRAFGAILSFYLGGKRPIYSTSFFFLNSLCDWKLFNQIIFGSFVIGFNRSILPKIITKFYHCGGREWAISGMNNRTLTDLNVHILCVYIFIWIVENCCKWFCKSD